jgi:hypothetical protein
MCQISNPLAQIWHKFSSRLIRVISLGNKMAPRGGGAVRVFLNSDAFSVHKEEPQQKAFRKLNYTQVPNVLMDNWLPDLTGAEVKILLYLVRRTLGFHRNSTEIGLRRICHGQPGKDRGTGLHLETASDAVKSLEARGLLTATRHPGGRTVYVLATSTWVYGKSEQPRSENPNGQVYTKPEHVERKSSSEKNGLKKSDDDKSAQIQISSARGRSPTKPNSKTITSKANDRAPNTNPQIIYSSPEDELRDIYRKKALSEMTPDLMTRLRNICELRGVTLGHFLEMLRPHVPNFWKNPPGFLTDFARKIHSKTPGPSRNAIGAVEIDLVIRDNGRCPRCRGIGTLDGDYCDCQLGRDLPRAEQRRPMTRSGTEGSNGRSSEGNRLGRSA